MSLRRAYLTIDSRFPSPIPARRAAPYDGREATLPEKPSEAREPLILWWMPLVALVAPLVWAAWKAVSADANGARDGLDALLWPGAALYLGTIAVLWAGWKIELE